MKQQSVPNLEANLDVIVSSMGPNGVGVDGWLQDDDFVLHEVSFQWCTTDSWDIVAWP